MPGDTDARLWGLSGGAGSQPSDGEQPGRGGSLLEELTTREAAVGNGHGLLREGVEKRLSVQTRR